MKIVCDNCGAKYSIADEKVAGKVFKIRCKKCSDVIVVRGDQVTAEDEESTKVFDPAGDAVWHVVVNGEQQGPFATGQIGGLLSEGAIDSEAYVWKEGFDGWKPLREVPELADSLGAAAGPAATAEAPAEPAAEAERKAEPEKADLFGGSVDTDKAEAEPDAAAATEGAKPAAADLFATPAAASPFGGEPQDQDVVASQPAPRVSAQQGSMTGQRNETSVLFSLSNLQALATGNEASSPSSAAKPAAPAAQASVGQAAGDGSGLIDIRALASAAEAPKPAPVSATAGSGAVDDLLAIGTGPAVGTGLGAPIIAPPPVEKETKAPNPKGLYAVIGVLAVGLVGAVAYFATREPEKVVVTQEAPAPATPSDAAPTAPTTVAAGADQGAAPPEAAPSAAGPSETSMAAGSSSSSRERDRSAGGRTREASSQMTAEAAPTAMTEEPASSMRSADLDSLMNDVIGTSSMTSQASSSNLPSQPSRDAVRRALGGRAGAVNACGDGGTAMAAVTFSSSGRVSSVRVSGVTGSVASCVQRAVRGARVPPFSRSSFSVNFPYRL